MYLDADLSHGPSYGNTLAWTQQSKPETVGPAATVQMKLDRVAFDRAFIALMKAPTQDAIRPAIDSSD